MRWKAALGVVLKYAVSKPRRYIRCLIGVQYSGQYKYWFRLIAVVKIGLSLNKALTKLYRSLRLHFPGCSDESLFNVNKRWLQTSIYFKEAISNVLSKIFGYIMVDIELKYEEQANIEQRYWIWNNWELISLSNFFNNTSSFLYVYLYHHLSFSISLSSSLYLSVSDCYQ